MFESVVLGEVCGLCVLVVSLRVFRGVSRSPGAFRVKTGRSGAVLRRKRLSHFSSLLQDRSWGSAGPVVLGRKTQDRSWLLTGPVVASRLC